LDLTFLLLNWLTPGSGQQQKEKEINTHLMAMMVIVLAPLIQVPTPTV